MIETFTAVSAALAGVPAGLMLRNLWLYRPPPRQVPDGLPGVSILIPARNEEGSIGDAVRAALASTGIDVEVVVLDDDSTDRTAAIVQALADADPRVRLERAPELPPGWNGKQHACAVLAERATYDRLLFVDADVRLSPDAAARISAFQQESGAALVSGVPREVTGSPLEHLMIPLIHFVLLGFLPISGMRRSRSPAYGAGCGQLFFATRAGYLAAGGHGADGVYNSRHDGLALPRAFRAAGLATDLFDATEVAACRMYTDAKETWEGLAKNATEGLGSRELLLPTTGLLLMGQVVPFVLAALALTGAITLTPTATSILVLAVGAAWVPRFAQTYAFRQSWFGALLHPLGVLLLVAVQWHAALRAVRGTPARWKGRSYAA